MWLLLLATGCGRHLKLYSFCSHCRLAKEKTVYEQEVVKQGEKIDKMKADGKDEYDIKKQVRKLAK